MKEDISGFESLQEESESADSLLKSANPILSVFLVYTPQNSVMHPRRHFKETGSFLELSC